jgi:hypothetical protein
VAAPGTAPQPSSRLTSADKELVPALIEWKVGLGEKDGPSPLIETVLPTTHRGVPVWRIVHRDPDGFRTSFQIVDRWATENSARVKWIDLQVTRKQVILTAWGRCDGFELIAAPRDGSFRIRQSVLAAAPQYPLNTEYRRGELVLASEVTRLVIAGRSPCAP